MEMISIAAYAAEESTWDRGKGLWSGPPSGPSPTQEDRRELGLSSKIPANEPESTSGPVDAKLENGRHSLYIELLGNAGLWSANYEIELRPEASFRVGFSSWDLTILSEKTEADILLIMVNNMVGLGSSARGEFGVGFGIGRIHKHSSDRNCFFLGSCGAKAVAGQNSRLDGKVIYSRFLSERNFRTNS